MTRARIVPDQRFPPTRRLHRPQEFEQVLRGSRSEAGTDAVRRRGGQWFALAVRPNGLGHSRMGIIAARRVVPHAVARNRHKRLIREAFRTSQAGLQGFDMVVRVVRPATNRQAERAAREELVRLMSAVLQ